MASLAPISQTRAAIYTRVSTLEQGERGYSLDAQADDCAKLAAELGAEVVATFTDQDSGASWDLPGLNALLDAARRREFDVLLVYDPDRLARRTAKQLVIEEELQRSGVTIRYVTLRIGESAEDQLLKNVRSSIAEYERSKIALRTSRGRRAKAEKGMIVGNGWAPYGYKFARDDTGRIVSFEPDAETSPVVQRIFADLRVMSVAQLCERLNAEGVPTYFRSTRGWQSSTVVGIIDNPVYLGTAAYGRRDTNKHRRDSSEWLTIAVPALVDRDTWDSLREAIERRRTKRGPHRIDPDADPYTLRNTVTCALCGGIAACTPNNGRRYYTCLRVNPSRTNRTGEQPCTLPAAPADALEAHVWQRVTGMLLDIKNLAEGIAEARDQHDQATARLRERLATVDREVARLRNRLQRITSERMDAEPGSEGDRALKALAGDVEGAIGRLLAERAELAAAPAPGLSQEHADALIAFAHEIARGITKMTTPADRRRMFEILRLRVTLRRDDSEDGIKLVRKNRFGIELRTAVDLLSNDRDCKKTRTKFYTPAYEEWEAQHMPQREAVPAS
jgi:site-specific DNA recombinase